jgi:putative ABC transport system permease protein
MQGEESSVAFAALLMNIYAGLALLLAAIGIYGVLAASVSARQRELGIRSAVGASPQQLLAGVVRDGVAVTGIAVVSGLAVAWLLGRSSQAVLFEVSPTDPLSFGAAATLVLVVALAATLIPARRAARIDPVTVLRTE